MTEKEVFIENMKKRTQTFAVEIINVCDSLKKGQAANVITYQLIKASSSTGANYRAACKARSKAEFLSKISIVEEEADESEYWLEIILEAKLSAEIEVIKRLLQEANEISKIVTSARNTTYGNKK
jgi:four helix bundle protein